MKLIKFKNIFFAALVLTAFSCEDFIGGDLNADPNKPLSVPVTGILPQVQISMADTYGGSFSRWNCMFTQQVEGVARQWSAFNQYDIQPVRFNDAWHDYYENVLVELKVINAEAEANGWNHYLAISKVIEAFTMMTATDVWGDIPYTEAALGAENFNPAYDDQATVIYPAVLTLLNDAITLFAGAGGSLVPGSDDLIYGGDATAWTRAANALLARYYLHMNEMGNAINAANNSFGSRADNMAYQYGSAPDGGQWYRFNDGRTGDIEFHPTMGAIMTGLNDTDRMAMMSPAFVTTTHPYLVDAYRQDLISYREIQFIIAEAEFSQGDNAAAYTAYLNGIDASFQEMGFASGGAEHTAYIAQAAVAPGAGALTLDMIMTQKYIGLFVQPEVYNDWRRTGIPALTPVSGSSIPASWQVAFSEELFNSNFTTAENSLNRQIDWIATHW